MCRESKSSLYKVLKSNLEIACWKPIEITVATEVNWDHKYYSLVVIFSFDKNDAFDVATESTISKYVANPLNETFIDWVR